VLARSLTSGHYGFNLSEFSSPASSILFPVLLVPFVWAGVGSIAALLINTTALVATTYRLHRWMIEDLHAAPRLATAATLAMVLGFNLLTLVFTGMEHSLQILLGVVIGEGRRIAEGGAPAGFLGAVATAPLVRPVCRQPDGRRVLSGSDEGVRLARWRWRWWRRLQPSACSHAKGLGWLPTGAGARRDVRGAAAVIVTLARNVLINANSHAGGLTALAALATGAAPVHGTPACADGARCSRRSTAGDRVAVRSLGACGYRDDGAIGVGPRGFGGQAGGAGRAAVCSRGQRAVSPEPGTTPRAAHDIFSQQVRWAGPSNALAHDPSPSTTSGSSAG
jgi:hypothetical protein